MPRNDGMEIEEAEYPEHGTTRDAAAEVSNLPWVRFTQRTPEPRDRRKLWLLLALVLLAHAVLGWLVWRFIHPSRYQRQEKNAIAVMLIEPPANVPPPPPLLAPPPPGQPPARPALPRPVHHEAPAKGAIQAQMKSVPEPQLELYQSNGQIRIPPSAATTASAPAYRAPEIKGSQIYSGKSPVPYKPTPFAKGFEPTNRSLGAKAAAKVGEVFDKAVDKTTLKKTIKVGDMKAHCAISPLLLFAGCKGTPPQPPPKNDNDIRLSMPPAETLTGKKVKLPASASSVPPPASSG